MSSMRNAVQRRNHKERAQPRERQKWGVLEKHKDYSLRAKDYNDKKRRLKVLQQKADDRNPDEFYHGMINNTAHKGRKHGDRGNPVLSQATVKLLKTQDAGYVQSALQRTVKAIEKLEQEVSIGQDTNPTITLGQGAGGGSTEAATHVLFADDEQEQDDVREGALSKELAPLMRFDDTSDAPDDDLILDLNGTAKESRRSRRAALVQEEHVNAKMKHRKEQNARRVKLEALQSRRDDLRDAERELAQQRAKISNSIGGVTKDGKKWRVRERKK